MSDENERPRLDLCVTLRNAGRDVDVRIDASPDRSVGELIDKARMVLEQGGAQAPGGPVTIMRSGRRLEAAERLESAGIRHGDVLSLDGRTPERRGDAQVILEITGGPGAGQRIALPAGEHVLGRSSACDVAIGDPSLSAQHLRLVVQGGVVQIEDLGSTNFTSVGGVPLTPGHRRVLPPGTQAEAGRTMFATRAPTSPSRIRRPHLGYLHITRPPRRPTSFTPLALELEHPPEPSPPPRLQLAVALVPLISGMVMFALFDNPVFLVFTLLSPLMAFSTYLSERRSSRKRSTARLDAWHAQMQEIERELAAHLLAEEAARHAEAPDLAELSRRALEAAPDLWNRTQDDDDFLCLRLGVADQPSRSRATVSRGGPDELRRTAEHAFSKLATVPSVPVLVDLRVGPLGLCGDRRRSEALARALIAQAAALHPPAELLIAAAVAEPPSPWAWLRWLPHSDPGRSPWEAGLVAVGSARTGELLEQALDHLERRIVGGRDRRMGPNRRPGPHLLLVLDEDLGLNRSMVSAILDRAAEANASVIWLGRDQDDLPRQCGMIARVEGGALQVIDVLGETSTSGATPDGLRVARAEEIARGLAPLVDVSATDASTTVPQAVSLLSLLDMGRPTAELVARRWSRQAVSLPAPVGVSAKGPLELDLVDAGPHALVIGGTGSGKSEFLRSMVASLAAWYPPSRVSFLLADYKGGSAFRPCAALPHVIEVITNLDAATADRAIVSLRAELERRQRLFEAHKVRDLDEMYRSGDDSTPPLLYVMVDEFAKVADDVPEFVVGIEDVARRGRALGVHLVIASQALDQGFVKGIRANAPVRISLRVEKPEDSEQVIEAPDAAYIPLGASTKGRAFARLGSTSLVEFQTGYVSGIAREGVTPPIVLAPVDRLGGTAPRPAAFTQGREDESDLAILAACCRAASAELGLPAPRKLWRPPLPDVLSLADAGPCPAAGLSLVVGRLDDPSEQQQDALVIDLLKAGNVAVFGTSASGRTTLLRTAAYSLAMRYDPDALHMFAICDSRRGLDSLDRLPHCGGVVRSSDLERLELLLRRLLDHVERASGASSAGPRHVVLLLDDLADFRALTEGAYMPHQDLLTRLMTSGPAAGVHTVVTADRQHALGARLSVTVGDKLALRMTTPEDLSALGLDRGLVKHRADAPAGRGWTANGLEFQTAIVGDRPGEPEEAVAAAAEIRAGRPGAALPNPVRVLPLHVTLEELPPPESLAALPVGLGGLHGLPLTIDLAQRHCLIAGPLHAGRTTALELIATSAAATATPVELVAMMPRRQTVAAAVAWSAVGVGGDLGTVATALARRVGGRLSDPDADHAPIVVVIDDAHEIDDPAAEAALQRIVRLGRDVGVTVVAVSEPGAARGILKPWLRELRGDGLGLLLGPLNSELGDLLNVRLPARSPTSVPPGRGVLVDRGVATAIQVGKV